MTRQAVALGALLLGAGAALAAPPLPLITRVVPVYTTPPAIRVRLLEAGGATYYTVYKKVGTGAEAVLTVLPAGLADDLQEYLDAAVAPHNQYQYRVDACDATGCTPGTGFTTSVDTVWPISGGRRVITGFNENIGWAGLRGTDLAAVGFHDGVDLGRTTTGAAPADDVLAPRGGRVVFIGFPEAPSVDNGFIEIAVDVGGGIFERDGFNHIASGGTLPVMVGDIVAPGQKIAVIGTRHFDEHHPATPSAFDDHVHYQLGASNSSSITIRHPLTVFRDDADRDPLGNLPALNDENGDGKTVRYRDHGSGALFDYDLATKPVRGDLDVAVEVTDRQGTKPEQAPVQLGYWIEGPLPEAEHLDDVKSAAHPYRVYDYRTEYWGKAVATPCDLISAIDDGANYGCATIGCGVRPPTCANSQLTEGAVSWGWPILHHFLVTHAGTETGTRTGLAKTQFWRTAAKDDGAPAVSSHANYAGQPTTTKAWEARFPDGDYDIHVLASDLVHTDVDVPMPPTRLENFAPFITEMLLTVDADGNSTTGRPETPGCEVEVYSYRQPARRQYPDPFPLAVARAAAGLTPIRAGASVCVRVRFSEPMSSAEVALVRDRGAGAVLAPLVGTLVNTHQNDDTWRGKATLAADPSGLSDSSFTNDEKDIAIRVVARDRRDRTNAFRNLDTDGDGVANPAGDVNHLVKVDLSPMEKTVEVSE